VPKSLDNPIDLAYGQASLIATCVRDWIGGRPMEGMLYSIIPPIIKDIDRIVSGMKLAGLHKAYIDNFYMMIKHGVDDRLLELISINGIGRKRAKALAHKNIRTKKEIVDNEVVSRNILGPKLYNAIKESITAPGKIRLIF
jgi:replicative superfamily II helicase